MSKPIMACGHAANAVTDDGKPICVICMCKEVRKTPSLAGRFAKCSDCGHKEPSDMNLPFFEYKPDEEYDSYYCGCYGWD